MTIDEFLGEAKTVAIFGHVRPDGDCVGSTTAVYNYIRDNFPGIAVKLFLENFPEITSPDIRPMGKSRHVFSHLRWEMLGYEIHLPDTDKKSQKKLITSASALGEMVSPKEYQDLAFASALRAYR